MKNNDKLNQKLVSELDISETILNILNSNKIKNLGQLCKKSRTDLRNIGLENQQINKLDIELQLIGLSLKCSI